MTGNATEVEKLSESDVQTSNAEEKNTDLMTPAVMNTPEVKPLVIVQDSKYCTPLPSPLVNNEKKSPREWFRDTYFDGEATPQLTPNGSVHKRKHHKHKSKTVEKSNDSYSLSTVLGSGVVGAALGALAIGLFGGIATSSSSVKDVDVGPKNTPKP